MRKVYENNDQLFAQWFSEPSKLSQQFGSFRFATNASFSPAK